MRAWLEIDLEVIGQNVTIIRRHVGQNVGLIAVVKADAYGMGLPKMAEFLDAHGVDMFAVIGVEEAFQIRQVSNKPILVMGYVDSKDLVDAAEAGLILSLYDKEMVPLYERVAARLAQTIHVHVKVETGFNRLGMSVDDAADFLMSQRLFPHLKVEGIFSHLANPTKRQKNLEQLQKLQELLVKIQGKCPVLPIHLTSSYALEDFKEGYFDAVRVGIALYGGEALPGLQQAVTCKAMVMQVKPVAKGEGVSYDHKYIVPKDITVAVIAIGHSEGLSRSLSGKLSVLIGGQKVPIIGLICMNLMIADVTGLPVKRGDEAVIIGSQKDKDGKVATIKPSELAIAGGISHHEVITRLGKSLPKFYLPR